MYSSTNAAEIESKVLEEMPRHPRSSAEGQSDLGTFVVPCPDGDSEAGLFLAIFKILICKDYKSLGCSNVM